MRSGSWGLLAVGLLAGAACIPAGNGERSWPSVPGGEYLGQAFPGAQPELFAPGLISTGFNERDTAISPAGDRLLYTLWGESRGTLVELKRNGDSWSGPSVAAFSGEFNDIEPHFDPSGGGLFFASQRPLPGESEPGDWNLWHIDLQDDTWGTPRPLAGVNGEGGEYYPSVTLDGTLYFTAQLPDSVGGEDIYRAAVEGDGYGAPQNLGPEVNSPGPEFNAFVSPDESFLIFGSVREGDEGGGDLYISFRDGDDRWTDARPMGAPINSPALDYCPFVSPDGRWLFFTSQRTNIDGKTERREWNDLVDDLRGPQNGQGDLYWIDVTVGIGRNGDRP